jgi:2-aminoadipate transaminase
MTTIDRRSSAAKRLSKREKGFVFPFSDDVLRDVLRKDVISFATGEPNFGEPKLRIREIVDRTPSRIFNDYNSPVGMPSLVNAIERWRSDVIGPGDRVNIVTGSHQGIDVLCRIFLDKNDTIIVPDTTYFAALATFRSYGANLTPVKMTIDAIDELFARLDKDNIRPKLFYIVSNYANPTGLSIGPEVMARVIELANSYAFVIVEDDPYGYLSYDRRQNLTIKELENRNNENIKRCVYISTFSKILAPGLRLGWASLPDWIAARFSRAILLSNVCANGLSQIVLENFISSGEIDRFVDCARDLLKSRAATMSAALRSHFAQTINFAEPHGGYYFWVELPDDIASDRFLPTAVGNGVNFFPGRYFSADGGYSNFIRLSISSANEAIIDQGVERLFKTFGRSKP